MNKYLLLRNNKQSGPYTVPEIIEMGLKAYDLVWLEGKSAAWRYPSEIEELKAYAPAVEEQPFDRFYKKPEGKPASNLDTVATPATTVQTAEHERYQPKIDSDLKQSRKVYINFPASSGKPVREQLENKIKPLTDNTLSTVLTDKQPAVNEVITKDTGSNTPSFPDRTSSLPLLDDAFSGYPSTSVAPKQTPDRRVLYASLTACLVLGLISFVLYFNYSKQKESLRELSTLVHELETREKEDHQGVPATLPQDASTSATTENNTAGILPEQILPSNNTADHNITSAKKIIEKKQVSKSSEAAITFKESKPVNTGIDEGPAEAEGSEIIPSANLFKLVEVKPNDYKTGVLGGISNLQFEITNNSPVELHRVAVEIKYLGPEKKVVKKQTVYFENVSPGAQTTIDVPKSNRGVTIEYTITDIKS